MLSWNKVKVINKEKVVLSWLGWLLYCPAAVDVRLLDVGIVTVGVGVNLRLRKN